MKLTKIQLKKIIKEGITAVMKENDPYGPSVVDKIYSFFSKFMARNKAEQLMDAFEAGDEATAKKLLDTVTGPMTSDEQRVADIKRAEKDKEDHDKLYAFGAMM